MTYMLLLNCALKLVEEIILYYDARSKKHKKRYTTFSPSNKSEVVVGELQTREGEADM